MAAMFSLAFFIGCNVCSIDSSILDFNVFIGCLIVLSNPCPISVNPSLIPVKKLTTVWSYKLPFVGITDQNLIRTIFFTFFNPPFTLL